ncbi:hypothetical protein FB45DRAFT_1035153 [Roridomyces roridus]|uniref:F-box domain-containing protein n=1 Tax=Roridomyces roridus TaxID=1738132 RepID=A0AAD7FCL8_9AGAR|nr:hypothetical protein FB45DRAFT_1035153 [Roridomyces roridus]
MSTYDCPSPEQIAKHLPHLSTLRLHVYSYEDPSLQKEQFIYNLVSALPQFKRLKSLAFEIPCAYDWGRWHGRAGLDWLALFSDACPSLEDISFPGPMRFRRVADVNAPEDKKRVIKLIAELFGNADIRNILCHPVVKSNRPLSDITARQMGVVPSSCVSEFSELDSRITVSSALDFQSNLIAGVQSPLSPVRTVPNEILGEIFVMCRDEALNALNYSPLKVTHHPLSLSHVSTQWRAVCLSDARLWDHIHVHSGARMPPTMILKEIFNRSRMRPLDINITGTPLDDLFRVILAAHTRVQRIVLKLDSSDSIADFWSYPRDFPALTTFELSIEGDRDADSTSTERTVGLSLFKTAPLLRSLLIWSHSSEFDPIPGGVVWSQITELTLDLRIDERTALSIIVACTRLEDCRVFIRTLSQPSPLVIPTEVTTLPHLQCLRVFGRQGRVAFTFFDGLSLPALTDVLLSVDELSPAALPNLYYRSRFHLKSLHIWQWIPNDLAVFLHLTSSLEELSFQFITFEDDLFEGFTYRPASTMPFVLPKLRSLVLSNFEGYEPSTGGVSAAEMAESFNTYAHELNLAFPSLRAVELRLQGDPFDDDVEDRLVRASGGIFKYERWDTED